MKDLIKVALISLSKLVIGLGILLFLPAGSLQFWQGWVFLLIFGGMVLYVTLYLWKHDPNLLLRRMKVGPVAESRPAQKLLQFFAQLFFALVFILPGLDYRYGWSTVSIFFVIAGNVMVLLGLYGIFLVFKENTFTAATVLVEEKQTVTTTGPYALVRHPMYSAALFMMAGIPLALGSWWSLLLILPFIVVIIYRLHDEERLLLKKLKGYNEYTQKVKYRLIPFLW